MNKAEIELQKKNTSLEKQNGLLREIIRADKMLFDLKIKTLEETKEIISLLKEKITRLEKQQKFENNQTKVEFRVPFYLN